MRSRSLRSALLLGGFSAALGACPPLAAATPTVEVKAIGDAEVRAAAPAANYGDRRAMQAGRPRRRAAFVKFSLARVSGKVTSAKLRVFVTLHRRVRRRAGLELYRTRGNWSEHHVTYRTKPAKVGAVLAKRHVARTGWVQYDVTSAVAGRAVVSFGLVGTSRHGPTVSTREGRHAPKLRIHTARAAAAPTGPPPAVAAPAPAPGPAPAAASPPGPPFVDDFSGPAGSPPDASKWVDYGPGCGGIGDWGSIACGSTEHLDGNGHLVIPASPGAGSGLQTMGRFGFVYGTMSAWIKMPSQPGYWPGFWSLNGTQSDHELFTGESDATESYSTWPGSTSTVHVWNGGSELWSSKGVVAGSDINPSNGFHKYSAKFEPGKITYYLDDALVGSVTKASAGGPWAWGPDVMRPNFLILDLAVGGASQKAPTAAGTMLVDRVEVTAP